MARTLCLGEALVDLICERPVTDFADADAFVPHFGGATANVAVSAARHGGAVGLAGGVGADAWGAWLRRRLLAEGVDLSWFAALEGVSTPLACVVLSPEAEPAFTIYGEALAPAFAALEPRIADAVADFDALFFASNTLTGPVERHVTEAAHREALRLGRQVIVDANLRLERWPSVAAAAAAVRPFVDGALLMRTNRLEAEVLTGAADPEQAALELLAQGARSAVVTLGADGAVLATAAGVRRVPGVASAACSTVGAGDAFTGVLIAALTRGGYDPSVLADALPRAVEEGARATERWGAVEARPVALD